MSTDNVANWSPVQGDVLAYLYDSDEDVQLNGEHGEIRDGHFTESSDGIIATAFGANIRADERLGSGEIDTVPYTEYAVGLYTVQVREVEEFSGGHEMGRAHAAGTSDSTTYHTLKVTDVEASRATKRDYAAHYIRTNPFKQFSAVVDDLEHRMADTSVSDAWTRDAVQAFRERLSCLTLGSVGKEAVFR
jgi:hypothetical protein